MGPYNDRMEDALSKLLGGIPASERDELVRTLRENRELKAQAAKDAQTIATLRTARTHYKTNFDKANAAYKRTVAELAALKAVGPNMPVDLPVLTWTVLQYVEVMDDDGTVKLNRGHLSYLWEQMRHTLVQSQG